jgi:aryl-alcohol dehydrogenase-like predicted oxidoreductase
MKTVELGGHGLRVSLEGFGAMGMSAFYGARDETESIATLNRAVDLGITLIDTAEAYGPFANEKLISRALGSRRDEVILATKWGTDFTEDGRFIGQDGSAEHARRAIDRSLSHLGADVIDLYYLHRVDPRLPIEESVGAMSDMVAEGTVRAASMTSTPTMPAAACHGFLPRTSRQTSTWSNRSQIWPGPNR